ncbi:MAG: hypothetical protein Q4F67_13285 [Propionibacteriaceae bacterium]|nr:hypothetical protein [Propionibacteriaceae bacterium]
MSQPLPADQERLLAAIVALETGRTFDGNEPAASLGLTSQLIGIEGEPGDGPWQVRLVVRDAPPIALSDGPLLGRYWVGAERAGEIVVRVRAGLLDSMEYAWSGAEPVRWPEPGEIAIS